MKYKIFLLAAFFTLDSAAMVGSGTANLRSEHPTGQHVATAAPAVMIGSGNIVDPRSEREMVTSVETTIPATTTVDLRAIYREAILDRGLNNFNFLLRQNLDKLENIYHDIDVWNILINSYNFENNSFNYRGLFTVVNNIKGVAMLNLSEDSVFELKQFLFAHKSAISRSSIHSLEKKWVTSKDNLIKRFVNTENSVLQFYEIYNSLIKIVCGFISLFCTMVADFIPAQQINDVIMVDQKCVPLCNNITPTSKITLKSLGLVFASFAFFGDFTLNCIKNKLLIVSKSYRDNVIQAAEVFALYLVLSNYENVGGKWSPEYRAMQAGIRGSGRGVNAANIVKIAIENLS